MSRTGRSLLLATTALSLFTLAWSGALAWVLWSQADAAQRDALRAALAGRGAFVALFVLLLPVLLVLLLRPWHRAWPLAATRLREAVSIVASSHPEHAITAGGSLEMRELAQATAQLASRYASAQRDVDQRIAQAQGRLAQETRRLAALMSELTQGVLVCNHDGRILLYNAHAAALFEPVDARDASTHGGSIGLGRSVFGVLDKAAIVHALDQASRRGVQPGASPTAQLITTRRPLAGADDAAAPDGQLLRVQMVLVRDDAAGGDSGYVLILEDITRAVESDSRREALLHQLTEGQRAALGSLRAAAETLQRFPALDEPRRARFVQVIDDESARLVRQLDEALARGADPLRSAWPREDMLAPDLLFAVQRSVDAGLGVRAEVAPSPDGLWLQLDSHAMVQALTHLAASLVAELGAQALVLVATDEGRFARLELRWAGAALAAEQLQQWERQSFSLGSQGRHTSVQEVLAQHGAESWVQAAAAGGHHAVCLQLPRARPERLPSAAPVHSRPVYYDFDLFHQRGQSAALDDTPLSALTFTVFDTETTGLSPSGGDEIISIGAVRIVNGRLLEHECFDRLVRPRRPVGEQALQVHGIGDEMLQDQPALEQVLPGFARFCADTVLVAHNAAFDMRFLELARERTGVAFEQPVLDTLLLSEAVHAGRASDEHHLEQIAERLGVAVLGRHTALGDAIVTGEVLLKLLPLLAERGVHTLGQARDASQRTSHARLRY